METEHVVGRHHATSTTSYWRRIAPHHQPVWRGRGRPPGSTKPHRAVDFDYFGGRFAKLNLSHPELRSPVAGVVTTNPGEGTFGRIAIRDANGFSHEILHTQTQYVKRGDLVGVGQPIGTMGNTGTKDQHVHYQLKDSAGRVINPTDFWDRLGPAKTDPGQPAYLGEYQQYLQASVANAANGFGNAPDTVTKPAPGSFDAPSDGSPPPYARQAAPRLVSRIAGRSGSSFFDTGRPAVPFTPCNDVLSSGSQNFFNNRSGNWTSLPGAPPNEALPADRQNSFNDRFGNWTSSPAGIDPEYPNQPAPQPGGLLGLMLEHLRNNGGY
jgi:hypothetical protein